MKQTESSGLYYDISVAARLTGLSTANLRAWEKRHNAADPARSDSGRRQYSEKDIRRLTLLKNLSDLGHPIRTTSSLTIEGLESAFLAAKKRIGAPVTPTTGTNRTGKCRIVLVGERIVELISGTETGLRGANTIAQFDGMGNAESGTIPEVADLLIIDCPALFADTVDRIQNLIDQTGAMRAIVVYNFAQAATVKQLHKGIQRITAIRAPVTLEELTVSCAADVALANRAANEVLANAPAIRNRTDDAPERKFSDAQLARISKMSTAIECECPNHLAALVDNLLGFERYSAECLSRNEADARMHEYLHATTAHARSIIEDALEVLIEFEGISAEVEGS